MDATKETELFSAVTDIGGDTDCILQMLRSIKEHHKEENTMDSNLAAALGVEQGDAIRNITGQLWGAAYKAVAVHLPTTICSYR